MRKALHRLLIGLVPSRKKRRQLREKYLSIPSYGVSRIRPPVNVPPSDLIDDFTLKGAIPLLYWYFNETATPELVITKMNYNTASAQFERRTFEYYGDYGNAMAWFYDALEKYPVKNKTVLIWGLTSCNLEAFALWKGASRVYVVDYNRPDCRHESVTVMTHDELRKSGLQTDFSFSFSSFEHDGLGRYGDPLNPSGDLEAMKEAKRYLKPGGIMFLGVPLGKDHIVWNAHRIYGPTRLPLLLEGWDCLDVFGCCGKKAKDAFNTVFAEGDFQPLMVLRASGNDEDNAGVTSANVNAVYQTQNAALLKEILDILRKDGL